MTEAELYARFVAATHESPVRVVFDTNVIHEMKAWRRVCRQLASLRVAHPNEAIIPCLVHGEMLFDLRQAFGADFDVATILSSLSDLAITLTPFEASDADAHAGRLWGRFPTAAHWRDAKATAYKLALGLAADHDTPGKGAACAATVDWFIAAQVAARDGILVSHDKGDDLAGVPRVTLATLASVVGALAPTTSP